MSENQNLKNLNLRGSIKRSRYVIIPYDIVEAAEEKYSKKKSNQKGSKRILSSGDDDRKDKSYRTYWKPRKPLSLATAD